VLPPIAHRILQTGRPFGSAACLAGETGNCTDVANLLFAVDGSPLALDAVRRALALIGPPASVTLLFAAPLTAAAAGAGGIEGPVYTPGELETLREAEARTGDDILTEAAAVVPAGYDVHRQTIDGDPGVAICDAAEELDADLVVVGNHGRNALARLVLGSTSTYVVHHCRKPVLVVRDAAADHAAAHDADPPVARAEATSASPSAP
jgi:nucleotide-binding universal stress UspA family protein